ncbi:MAG: hypothetical protein E7679_04265 [Ruminococcaceae bacterium]|nr:hypothetical protein [Oscillospiraceae bacterium]
MKKSVVIIIALIYIASIALVSFFGLQFKVFEEVIPVERIEIINDGQKYSESQGDYIVIRPNEKGELRLKIDYRVYPENASNTKVDFAYEEVDYATVDEYGVVTFSRPGILKVRIIAKDGSNAEDTLLIIATK